MSDDARLQPGIHHRTGEKPPAAYRALLLDVAPAATPMAVREALATLYHVPTELARDKELHDGLAALVGYGRRLFDDSVHDPPLTRAARPDHLAYLDQRHNAFPPFRWARTPAANRGESDVVIQLTGPHDASVSCGVAELVAAVTEQGLPLEAVAVFAAFGRPDGRGWLGFHDGVSNLEASRRPAAIVSSGDPRWLAGGTTMALLRLAIDLRTWRGLTRAEQELLVGRDRDTGAPLVGLDADGTPLSRPSRDPETDRLAFADPPETTVPAIERSHVHRANQSRASPDAPAALRIFRQGYDYLETTESGPLVTGLNFVSFQADLATIVHLLHAPGWLGDVNFGGEPDEAPAFIALADGGLYVVPPHDDPFPGAGLFG